MAELLAALSYGERLARTRARDNIRFAPDQRRQKQQQAVARREAENAALIEARLIELGGKELEASFAPHFDAFFSHTTPTDWLEAQAWHYIGDALVRDFADALLPALDPVSAEVVRRALAERDEQESFALDEVTAMVSGDPGSADRVAAFARRIIGEGLTQTRRALDGSVGVGELLGGEEGEKRALLALLQSHRERLDRLGVELVD